MTNKKYKVEVGIQGNAVVSNYGYVEKESDEIILLYVDAWGDTGRAYPTMYGTRIERNSACVPEIWLAASEDDTATLISFPELTGWEVFCASGGKTLSIAFQKGRSFE